MAKRYFFIGLTLLFVQSLNAQSEIKVYGEYLVIPGLSYEHALKNDFSVELGASFLSKKANVWHGLQLKDQYFFLNAMVKKYRTNRKGKKNFFYGAFINYVTDNRFAVGAEEFPLPSSIQRLLDSDYSVSHKTVKYKVSLGVMVGYKWPVGSRMTVGLNMGMGFSLPSMFWQKKYTYNEPVETSQVGPNFIYGHLNHLSPLAQFSVGYRFAKR